MSGYCDEPYCEDPKNPGFPCVAFRNGKCSTHVKQLQRTGKTKPIAERRTLEERAIDAGSAMLEADDDREYTACRRAFLQACRALGESVDTEAESAARRGAIIKEAMARARARGVHVGRPPRATDADIERLYAELKSVEKVGQAVSLTARAIYYRLKKGNLFSVVHTAEQDR